MAVNTWLKIKMRIIKKYPNRRLYDTSLGEYITLDDVKELVFAQENFQVIDARSKKDLTQQTLLQIILEQEATNTPTFTTALLQDFIRLSNEKSQSLLTQYLEHSMKIFNEQRTMFQNQVENYQRLLSDPTFINQTMELQMKWWKDWLSKFSGKK